MQNKWTGVALDTHLYMYKALKYSHKLRTRYSVSDCALQISDNFKITYTHSSLYDTTYSCNREK